MHRLLPLLGATLLCAAACDDPTTSTDSGPRADSAVGVDAGSTGGDVCSFAGARACLDALEVAAACWQASGECTMDASGDFSFESGATASTDSGTVTYAMNGTTCFSGVVSGTTTTYMTPSSGTWTAVVASDGMSAEWTCPGGETVTVQTNEQPNCLTASSSAANTALATCF